MKASYISLLIKLALAVAVTIVSTSILFGQEKAGKAEHKAKYKEFCSSNNWSNGDRVSFSEVREMTVPASGSIAVDAGRNGGISVKGENRSDVLVKACVQAWGITDEAARSLASSVRISGGPVIKAEGATDEAGWSVSYQVFVPTSTDLNLRAHNGGIAISNVEGRLEFETTNGGVSLSEIAGDVKGRTTNGGVNVSLSGSNWRGSGLDVQTTNGGVHLSIPETFAANIETGTTNGGFKSDISALNAERTDRQRSMRINTALNGGGAPIRVVTTNGGIKISSSSRTVY